MSELDELRERVDALATEVERLRHLEEAVTRLAEDTTRTHTLAAMADRDSSELRVKLNAQLTVLNALHKTQSEHTATLRGHGDVLGMLIAGQARLETGQAEILEILRGTDRD